MHEKEFNKRRHNKRISNEDLSDVIYTCQTILIEKIQLPHILVSTPRQRLINIEAMACQR